MPARKELGEFARALSAAIAGAGRWNVRLFGSSLVFAYIAAGRVAGCAFASSGITVHNAAGLLVAREAGALICDERGRAWGSHSAALVMAASVELQTQLLELVRATAIRATGP